MLPSHSSCFCVIFWHFALLSFPRFVFIMGTSVALSINTLLRSGATRYSLLRKVAWRSLQLFLIGVLVINPNYCQGLCEYELSCLILKAAFRGRWLNWTLWPYLVVLSAPTLLILPTVSWDNLRIPGVLQRLAWSYLVVACLDLLVARGQLDILTTVSQQLDFFHLFIFCPASFNNLCRPILY